MVMATGLRTSRPRLLNRRTISSGSSAASWSISFAVGPADEYRLTPKSRTLEESSIRSRCIACAGNHIPDLRLPQFFEDDDEHESSTSEFWLSCKLAGSSETGGTDGGDVTGIGFRTPFEDRRTRDQRIRAGCSDQLSGIGIDASIDFQADWAFTYHGANAPNLFELLRDERLTTEAWIHRHDQHEVNFIKHITQHVLRRRRADRHAGLLAQPANYLKGAIQMRIRFCMDSNDIRARFREGFQIGVDRCDHEMHIEYVIAIGAQRLHDFRSEADIRHEVPIHHIEMQPIGSCRHHVAYLLTEAGEIGRKNRRGNKNRLSQSFFPFPRSARFESPRSAQTLGSRANLERRSL